MPGMTFDSLTTELKRYAQRGNAIVDASTLAEIPHIITRVQVSTARELKIQADQITVTSTMDPLQNGVVYKPIDWLDTISINFGTGDEFNSIKSLYPRSYEYCNMYWPDRTEQGEPEYYADYDQTHWLFVGCPDQEYPFEVLYHATPPLLSASNQTNWMTQLFPDLLLNRSVIGLGNYLNWKTDRLAPFQAEEARAMSAITTQDVTKVVDRATTRRTA